MFRSLPARFLRLSSPDCVRWTLEAVRKCSAGQLRSVPVPIHTCTYMYLLPYIISTYIPFLSCVHHCRVRRHQAVRQTCRQTEQTEQTAQLSPPRCGHQQRMRMARPSSLCFPSFPFPSLPSRRRAGPDLLCLGTPPKRHNLRHSLPMDAGESVDTSLPDLHYLT